MINSSLNIVLIFQVGLLLDIFDQHVAGFGQRFLEEVDPLLDGRRLAELRSQVSGGLGMQS